MRDDRKPSSLASNKTSEPRSADASENLNWLRARYHLHTFTYRDPRTPSSSGPALPVVSPTAVLLGIASTLFSLGLANEASDFFRVVDKCKVVVDPPEGVIFFRAFHQIRRYETDKYDKTNPRLGLTAINQAMREHGLPQGNVTVFVAVPREQTLAVRLALENRDHLGTHDSLCSLVGEVELCEEPKDVVYVPLGGTFPFEGATIVSLSRFRGAPEPKHEHWWLAGGTDTEIVPYVILGRFIGTSRGKVYRKHQKVK